MRRNEDEMDNQKLADLLFPEVVNTPEYYGENCTQKWWRILS